MSKTANDIILKSLYTTWIYEVIFDVANGLRLLAINIVVIGDQRNYMHTFYAQSLGDTLILFMSFFSSEY